MESLRASSSKKEKPIMNPRTQFPGRRHDIESQYARQMTKLRVHAPPHLHLPLHYRNRPNIRIPPPNKIIHQRPNNHPGIHHHRPIHRIRLNRRHRGPKGKEIDRGEKEKRSNIDREPVSPKRPPSHRQRSPVQPSPDQARDGDVVGCQEGDNAEGDDGVEGDGGADVDEGYEAGDGH